MNKVLVRYYSMEGQTEKVARRVAEALRRHDYFVDVRSSKGRVELAGYDGVIIGASIHVGKYPKELHDYIGANLQTLNSTATMFLSVCLTAAGDDDASKQQAEGYIQGLLDETGWKPDLAANFAGALRFRSYGFIKRRLMKSIAKRQGLPTDTSHDYEFTDWDSVDHFAEDFIHLLDEAPSPVA